MTGSGSEDYGPAKSRVSSPSKNLGGKMKERKKEKEPISRSSIVITIAVRGESSRAVLLCPRERDKLEGFLILGLDGLLDRLDNLLAHANISKVEFQRVFTS